mmetsp:Transcript_92813/g.298455  ORF Transcript_92813/g.298455 Transcript_92813/m.298455 type:complete len:202 (+) Transcript_92813:887-1492(+)
MSASCMRLLPKLSKRPPRTHRGLGGGRGVPPRIRPRLRRPPAPSAATPPPPPRRPRRRPAAPPPMDRGHPGAAGAPRRNPSQRSQQHRWRDATTLEKDAGHEQEGSLEASFSSRSRLRTLLPPPSAPVWLGPKPKRPGTGSRSRSPRMARRPFRQTSSSSAAEAAPRPPPTPPRRKATPRQLPASASAAVSAPATPPKTRC